MGQVFSTEVLGSVSIGVLRYLETKTLHFHGVSDTTSLRSGRPKVRSFRRTSSFVDRKRTGLDGPVFLSWF